MSEPIDSEGVVILDGWNDTRNELEEEKHILFRCHPAIWYVGTRSENPKCEARMWEVFVSQAALAATIC
eukprot:7390609-Prymnesium_polylepis.1